MYSLNKFMLLFYSKVVIIHTSAFVSIMVHLHIHETLDFH